MALAFRRVTPDEVEPLHRILVECGVDMAERLGLTHGTPAYPLDWFRESARDREVYAVDDPVTLVGTFTVGKDPLFDYDPGRWTPDTEPALYLNRLAVIPARQGTGLGRACMDEVERIARDQRCGAVRFDCVAAHEDGLAFYDTLGYERRGPWREWGIELVLFEKVLPPGSRLA
jgi:GNAT superfamily N-acetyltransferase